MAWSTPSGMPLADASGAIDLSVGDQPLVVQLLPAGADLVVASAGVVGGDAHAGQPVKLKGVVTNRGSAPTPPGLILAVTFFDMAAGNPKMLTYGAQLEGSLAPGQSVDIVTDGTWTPNAPGKYSLDALVDDLKRIPETDRSNDHLAFTVDVK